MRRVVRVRLSAANRAWFMVEICDVVDAFFSKWLAEAAEEGKDRQRNCALGGEGDGATGDRWGNESEDEMTMRVAMARRKLNALKKCRE